MKKLLMLLMVCLVTTGAAYAQQDPEDPGLQDSIIVGVIGDHLDSTNSYQFKFVQIYVVNDERIVYYNLPLRWNAPMGGVSCGPGTLYNYPLNQWDEHYDTVLAAQGYVRQFGFCNTSSQSNNPPIDTDMLRVHAWSLRFIIAPNTRSQLVVIDTTWDTIMGRVAFTDSLGEIDITPAIQRGFFSIGAVGTDEDVTQIPDEYTLSQNYPNPFNPETNIEFSLPKAQQVSLVVYNLLGQEVRTLVNETKEAGIHTAHWDGKNDKGADVPSGVYFYRMVTPEFNQTSKMSLIR